MTLEGETMNVALNYTGTGTGLVVNMSYSDSQRERCGFNNLTLYSSTGAIAFDFTGGNYGHYHNFEINSLS